MNKQEWFDKASQAVVDAEEDEAVRIAKESIDAGVDPLEMLNEGFSAGIKTLGDLFDRGEIFLPHLIMASEAMVSASKVLEGALPKADQEETVAKVVLGTIEGDVHDIGKGIVATMLRVYGFEVHDLGRDVPIGNFVAKAQEVNANVVGSSALMTTTQAGQKRLEEALKQAGLREKVKTMVGGAVSTQHWADKIGADLYAESATEAVSVLKEVFSK